MPVRLLNSVLRKDSRALTILIVVVWTFLVGATVYWLIGEHRRDIEVQTRLVAEMSLQRDLAYRWWSADHGGVYVPVSETNPPNPLLLDLVPERDIVTPSGRLLTLVNPSYMMRQVYEMSGKGVDIVGHLTSLKPIRPENAPDHWERAALEAFEQGATAVSELQEIEGRSVLRFMKPFLVEKGCLKCHEQQGYREGQIRGGISIAVPTAPFVTTELRHRNHLIAAVAILWLGGLLCVFLGKSYWGERIDRRLNQDLQKEIALRTAQLEEKNRELDRFNHVVAHDLRAPLITITGFAEMLSHEEGIAGNENNRQLLEQIVTAARRMTSFIATLLAYASLGKKPLRQEAVALDQVFENVTLALSGPIAEKQAKLAIPPGAPVVRGDEELLFQVFLNLVQNGIKYARREVSPVIALAWREEGERIVVEVSDNGIGIPPEDQGRIFESFVQLSKGGQGGFGIGLASVRKALGLMGGDIAVRSTSGEGSVFSVTLPANLPG